MSAVTDPSIPTPEIPVSEARSFEGYVSAMPVEPQVAPASTTGFDRLDAGASCSAASATPP